MSLFNNLWGEWFALVNGGGETLKDQKPKNVAL